MTTQGSTCEATIRVNDTGGQSVDIGRRWERQHWDWKSQPEQGFHHICVITDGRAGVMMKGGDPVLRSLGKAVMNLSEGRNRLVGLSRHTFTIASLQLRIASL